MVNNRLILRTLNSPWLVPLPDITKGSVLTHTELDNNFLYLKGEVIYSASTINDEILFHKINGENITVKAPQNNISKTIYITSTDLNTCTTCDGVTLEDKIAQYVTSLGLTKEPTDSDIWVEFEDIDGIFTFEFDEEFD